MGKEEKECSEYAFLEKNKKSEVEIIVLCGCELSGFSSIASFEECFNSYEKINNIKKLIIDGFSFNVSIWVLKSLNMESLNSSDVPKTIYDSVYNLESDRDMGRVQGFSWRYLYYLDDNKVNHRTIEVTRDFESPLLMSYLVTLMFPKRRFYLVSESKIIYKLTVEYSYHYELKEFNE